MPDARFLTATVEIFNQEYGVWCDACSLPSAKTTTFATVIGDRMRLSSQTVCVDCGARS